MHDGSTSYIPLQVCTRILSLRLIVLEHIYRPMGTTCIVMYLSNDFHACILELNKSYFIYRHMHAHPYHCQQINLVRTYVLSALAFGCASLITMCAFSGTHARTHSCTHVSLAFFIACTQ